MAATNVKRVSGVYLDTDGAIEAPRCVGTGAPADSDALCTDTEKYPKGTMYVDTTNSKVWHRVATAGVAADFKGAAIS